MHDETVLDPESIMARARRGYEWAMSTFPDRLARVDADTLDISEPSLCAGAQMFAGNFFEFEVQSHLSEAEVVSHGFLATGEEDMEDLDYVLIQREYAALTEAWQKLLRGEA